MSQLVIEGTAETPFINFDSNVNKFEITGASLPPNIFDFYQPVLEWFRNYSKQPNKDTNLELRFEYLNSSSTKMIMTIISVLEEIENNGMKVGVTWFYEFGDQEMKEMGEDFASACNVPFKMISLKR
ncbi:MAG: DUF1987 domain-containing protein [Bacteroidales bacterium]|nr:DUF1987 domain-containing protein [Bacteroidales bacterium]